MYSTAFLTHILGVCLAHTKCLGSRRNQKALYPNTTYDKARWLLVLNARGKQLRGEPPEEFVTALSHT